MRDLKQKQMQRENLPERNFMACNVLKEDDLKEILVDIEAKGIKTQKEGDKKTIQGNIAIHQ